MPERLLGVGRGELRDLAGLASGLVLAVLPRNRGCRQSGIGSRGLQRAMEIKGRAISDTALLSMMGTKRKGLLAGGPPVMKPDPGLADQVGQSQEQGRP